MGSDYDVLVIGGGHGGAQAAAMLRQHGFDGTIGVVGEEPEFPYDRPPLSKEYLSGEKAWERLLFRSADAWRERRIDFRLGTRVVGVDAQARRVSVEGGEPIGYRHLVWATGGSPRRLTCSGSDLAGVHSVRSRADVDAMMKELGTARSVAVIGGGYIGLEAAAVLTKLGKKVIVLEALDRVLARVAGEPLSRFFESEHRGHGVDVRLETHVECIEEQEGRACGVRLAGGEIIAADMVVVGIGIVPSVDPLIAAGADGGNGVRVDGQCRTSLPGIFAVGDCAEHRNRFAGDDWIRLESVQNANDQASVVAQTIAGKEAEYAAVPWFWSNQYDLKLQTVGISRGFDDLVVRGDPESRAFSVVYLRAGKVVALDCVNMVRDYVQGRGLVLAGAAPDKEQLADAGLPLKSLL